MKTISNQSNKPPIGVLALLLAAPLVCNGQAVPSGVADAELNRPGPWTGCRRNTMSTSISAVLP
jgi:hypothetical protein